MPDPDRAQDRAEQRQHDRAGWTESTLDMIRDDLGQRSYPVRSGALAEAYTGRPLELPEEFESLADVFGRIDERFEGPRAAYEAYVEEAEVA